MAQTVAEILIDQMVEAGIRKVYGIVGDSANPIVDALRRHESDIEFVHVRNEEAGAFAAGADAQISGRPTAVLGSSGPGSLHLINGLYDCQRNAAPVFAIATHIPSTEIGSGYFQETNPEAIFSGCTNYCALVSTAGQMPRVSELALQAAILERGVGMIILPGDIAAQTVEHEMLRHPILTDRPVIRPDRRGARQGRDPHRRRARRSRSTAARARGTPAPRCSASRRLCRRPSRSPTGARTCWRPTTRHRVGMTGLLGWGGATEALADCDLLLMLGTDFPYHAFLPAGKTIIQVDDKPLHLGRRAAVDLGLVGDVGETLRALIPLLEAAHGHRVPRQDRQAPPHDGEGHPDLRRPRGQRSGPAAGDGGDGAERPRRGRRRLHRRHGHVQRLGRPLPADEAGPPDPGVVQPRVHGQRHAAGHRRQGRLTRPPGHRPVRRRRLLDADGRAAHGGRARHPGQAHGLQQLHARAWSARR